MLMRGNGPRANEQLKAIGRLLYQLRKRKEPKVRRVDVASNVDIHEDTYARIEQGRYTALSIKILKRILIVLGATPDEVAYAMNLYVSWGLSVPFFHTAPNQMTPQLQQMLDDEEPHPAYIINKRWDIIGCNRFAPIVFPMIPCLGDPDVRNGSLAANVLYFMFLNPMSQHIIVAWEKHVKRIVQEFRTDYAKHSDDDEFIALVEYLNQHSELFRTLWQTPVVKRKSPIVKDVQHPTLGRLRFQQMGTRPEPFLDLMFVFYKPGNEETKRILNQIQL